MKIDDVVEYLDNADWGLVTAPKFNKNNVMPQKGEITIKKAERAIMWPGRKIRKTSTFYFTCLVEDAILNQLLTILDGFHEDIYTNIYTKTEWVDMTGWTVVGNAVEDSGAMKLTHVTWHDDGSIAYTSPTSFHEIVYTGYANVNPDGVSFRGLLCTVLDDLGGTIITVGIQRPPAGQEVHIYVNNTSKAALDRTKTWDVKIEFHSTVIKIYYREHGTTTWTYISLQTSITGRPPTGLSFATVNNGLSAYNVTVDNVSLGQTILTHRVVGSVSSMEMGHLGERPINMLEMVVNE